MVPISEESNHRHARLPQMVDPRKDPLRSTLETGHPSRSSSRNTPLDLRPGSRGSVLRGASSMGGVGGGGGLGYGPGALGNSLTRTPPGKGVLSRPYSGSRPPTGEFRSQSMRSSIGVATSSKDPAAPLLFDGVKPDMRNAAEHEIDGRPATRDGSRPNTAGGPGLNPQSHGGSRPASRDLSVTNLSLADYFPSQ